MRRFYTYLSCQIPHQSFIFQVSQSLIIMATIDFTPGGTASGAPGDDRPPRKPTDRQLPADKPAPPIQKRAPPQHQHELWHYVKHWNPRDAVKEMSDQAQKIMGTENTRRPIVFHRSQAPNDFQLSKNHVMGIVIASRGLRNPVPCGHCSAGLTPFAGCYSYTPNCPSGKYISNGACCGCVARNKTAECEYSKFGDSKRYSALLTLLRCKEWILFRHISTYQSVCICPSRAI